MLTFYTHPQSRGRIVRWMLEETGQVYDTVSLTFSDLKDDGYRAVNPLGKVPAIVHDGNLVTEAAAICAYLADAFPETGLAPTSEERASYYRWLFFMAGPGEAAVVDRMLGVTVTDEQRRFVGYASYDEMVDMLELATSAHAYIAGPRFTAADVYFGSQIITGTAVGSLPDRVCFRAYRNRLVAREGFQRAAACDDALAETMA